MTRWAVLTILCTMPIYEYRCAACDRPFERLVRSDTAVQCPSCGSSKVMRLMSVIARPAGSTAPADYSRLGPPQGGGCCGGGCGCH